ncbi:MAG: hypothetical protein KAR79_04635, partial [Simkaniaceae bacterium]|nr:hypothetical protein [Simkaniaceae bacterium]
ISPQIGSLITANESTTPRQYYRGFLFGLYVTELIASVFFFSASICFATPLLGALATATLAGSFVTIFHIPPDFDSPTHRQQITEQIAQQSLAEIAAAFSREEVIGYALLGQTTSPTTYHAYSCLERQISENPEWLNQELNLVRTTCTQLQEALQSGATTPPNTYLSRNPNRTEQVSLIFRQHHLYSSTDPRLIQRGPVQHLTRFFSLNLSEEQQSLRVMQEGLENEARATAAVFIHGANMFFNCSRDIG